MLLALISPEGEDPREQAALCAMLDAGLERYHLRKPGWSAARLAAWLGALPPRARGRIVLHQHHPLVALLGLGGRHWRAEGAPARPEGEGGITSRSCHDLAEVRASLGVYDALFLSPVFPSISKPGHGPRSDREAESGLVVARSLLSARGADARRTAVLALGGVTPGRVARCREAGFDGVAVLGAVWSAADPVAAFLQLRRAAEPALPRIGGTSPRGAWTPP
jgi:thiamine-phosphate pyrophosphorylase